MLLTGNKKLKNILRIAIPLVLIPGAMVLGVLVFDEKRYAFIAVAIALLSLLLFYVGIEKRTVGTRRMVIIAVMTALSIIGRFIFSLIPAFKPVTAMVIITAVWLGPESGFLVGSLSALISNFYFGQGPWTPFQMFAWGLIGLIAGYLSNPLRRSRIMLAVYGAIAGMLFSAVMDVWTVMWYQDGFSLPLYLAALATALPHTITYAASNVIFLLTLGRTFGEKLERVKYKYGI